MTLGKNVKILMSGNEGTLEIEVNEFIRDSKITVHDISWQVSDYNTYCFINYSISTR